jgi:hypothetical protein
MSIYEILSCSPHFSCSISTKDSISHHQSQFSSFFLQVSISYINLTTHISYQQQHPNTPQIKNPQSALLSNHEVLLHLRKEEAEYTGTDGTGRKRPQPSGLNHMLRDVSPGRKHGYTHLQTLSTTLFTSSRITCSFPNHKQKGLAYLQTPDYTINTLASTHPTRPMTLYKGPHSLFRALAPKYRLNKAEYLQLYNLRPGTQVMLELVIEEVSPDPLPCFLHSDVLGEEGH